MVVAPQGNRIIMRERGGEEDGGSLPCDACVVHSGRREQRFTKIDLGNRNCCGQVHVVALVNE